jgi:LysM repeat protein
MIESQSKLPGKSRGSLAVWDRGREALATVAGQIRTADLWVAGRRGAQYAGDLASRLGSRLEKTEIETALTRVWGRVGDGSLLNRYALHLVVVLLALGVVTLTQVAVPQVDFFLPTPTPAPVLGARSVTEASSSRGADRTTEVATNRGVNRLIGNSAALAPALVPHTTHAEHDRMQNITYTVQSGDNVWSIATGFGLQPETVLWANPKVERSPDLLSVGQRLIIPPVDGIWYTVERGDTVEKLAKTYQTSVEKIVSFTANDLEEPYNLVPGQQIMLPDGRKKVVVLTNRYPMTFVGKAPDGAPTGSGRFAWPAQGYLSQKFWSGHSGIDIASRTGTPIRAADDGYVRLAGRDTWGYGIQILVDHGNGYLTRYAHLHTLKVKAGDFVKKGQVIGTMGSTGRSTGPHLHFEVIYSGVARNPLGFLP